MQRSAHFVRVVTRVLVVLSCLVIVSSVASGYTIVMLSGRRIQIPEQFAVTKTTLTYDVGATISATLLIAAIDVSATERANSEAPGSLLKRAADRPRQSEGPARSQYLARPLGLGTITNESLEPYSLARKANEAAYEKRRIELGWPSLEELRRKAAADAVALSHIADAQLLIEARSEEYWRARATALRDDLAYVDGQISFLQTRLEDVPANPLAGAIVIGNGPFSAVGHSRIGQSPGSTFGPRRSVFVAPPVSRQFPSIGSAGRGRALINPTTPRPGFRGPLRPTFGVPVALFGSLSSAYDIGYDAPTLRIELDRLLTVRAGLEASQRQLEDEARRAGASPGWLRQ